MASLDKNWLSLPNVTVAKTVVIGFIWAMLIAGIDYSPVGRYVRSKVTRVMDFQVRDLLGQSPNVHPNLKIYAVDDSTYSALDSWVLDVEQWSLLLESLAAQKPKVIVIDAMFSKVIGQGQAKAAIARLESLDVPIVVGSFAVPKRIRFRHGLDRDQHVVRVSEWTNLLEKLPDFREPNGFVYGPHPDFSKAFPKVGHFLYDGSGNIFPFLRVLDDGVLPHVGLLSASSMRINREGLFLDERRIPLDSEGELMVNFVPAAQLYSASHSVLSAFERQREGKPQAIKPGDVALIIPFMYTGNTDFKTTPLGFMPGGLIIASLINSVLHDLWLKPLGGKSLIIMTFCGIGAWVGSSFAPLAFSLIFVGICGLIVGFRILGFAYLDIMSPWFFCVSGYALSALTVFAEKTRIGEKKVEYLRNALQGSLPEGELKSLLKRPHLVNLEPKERAVTVMFVDVVGFSLVAEKMQPRLAFDNLKEILGRVGDIVHAHGGIIDKTLGDGLLCYFGYSFEHDVASPEHAEQAIRAAIEIQRDNVERILSVTSAEKPIFPLRIGVNTTSCYLGDLGSFGKIDLTVVGNGVNFAKRLEAACDMHKILIGNNTHELVQDIGIHPEGFRERWIHIKHHRMPVQAYQYDPFVSEPGRIDRAHEVFRRATNVDRGEKRWNVPEGVAIRLKCSLGEGEMVNFSYSGVCGRFTKRLGTSSLVSVVVTDQRGSLEGRLHHAGIFDLRSEICWTYEEEGGTFAVGFRFTDLTQEQKIRFAEILEDYITTGLPLQVRKSI